MAIAFTGFTLIVLLLWVAWLILRFEALKESQEAFHDQVNRLVTALYNDEPELWLKPKETHADSLTERWDV